MAIVKTFTCGGKNLEKDINLKELSYDEITNLAKKLGIGTLEYKKIFEWWKVDPWMMSSLINFGEAGITKFNIWGRTTTGQAIKMDWVIKKITENLWKKGQYFKNGELSPPFFI